jgi:hypothetical protein
MDRHFDRRKRAKCEKEKQSIHGKLIDLIMGAAREMICLSVLILELSVTGGAFHSLADSF